MAELEFENTMIDAVGGLGVPWCGAPAPAPRVLVANDVLARSVGIDPAGLRSDDGAAVLAGGSVPAGASPVAMAYSGHQFGGFAPLLGDGRALLLGELRSDDGTLVDLHLKGSGPTPFSRGGDGRAVLGPMLREYVISEAMHALGIPTTRSLAVSLTGEDVVREGPRPGAVLARIASSHLRVGTFEYASRRSGLVQPLADYSIARHYPNLSDLPAATRYVAFFEAVVEAQASLVARWMLVGFVHGVMNTDNTTISGETIDYGPCAFLDSYDPAAVFSSIDHGGRYAFGHQPGVLGWNLARFGETLLPLVDAVPDDAIAALTGILDGYGARYEAHFMTGMTAKLGLTGRDVDPALVVDLLELLRDRGADWTSTFRGLADHLRGDSASLRSAVAGEAVARWVSRWRKALSADGDGTASAGELGAVADAMDRVNPVYIPRNHRVDEALRAAGDGDMEPFRRLLEAVTHPFDRREEWARFAEAGPQDFSDGFRTFCGT